MTKSTKIMLSVIGGVLAVCIAITAAVSISKSGKTPDNTTTISDSYQSSQSDTAASAQTTVPAPVLSEEIIGEWKDSANMSGYKFESDGSVEVTYVNLTVPVINMPINETANGSYTLAGDELTVSFSIYSKTITKTFTASVENNALVLKNKEDGEVATYNRVTGETQTTAAASVQTTAAPVSQTGLTGTWVSGSGDVKYTFNDNSTASVTLTNANIPSVSSGALSGTYDGVYLSNENDMSLTVQFTAGTEKITQKFTYAVSGNALSLTNENGDTTIFVRQAVAGTSTEVQALYGKWSDSSGMSGYEFKEDGSVEITYVNFVVPVVNMPINGTYTGTYIVNGDKVTITASIYSKTVVDEYTFSVSGNTLSLVSVDDGELSTYSRK